MKGRPVNGAFSFLLGSSADKCVRIDVNVTADNPLSLWCKRRWKNPSLKRPDSPAAPE